MNNRSFVRLWAPLIAALVFAIAFLATHFVLNPRETAAAVSELDALIDMAETRAAAEQESLKSLDTDADDAALRKARTVERFLAHDDTLLAADALAVLSELIGLERVTVADGEGTVVAATDAALIGTGYAEDAELSWSMALLEDGAEPITKPNGAAGRVAGVPRTDIDGFILVWNREAILADVSGEADLTGAVEHLAVTPDAIKLVETAGEDGTFEKDGMLYVQRAEGDVTVIAWRPLSEVHAVQRAVLTSLAVFAAVSIIALTIWQLTAGRKERQAEETDEPEELEESEQDAFLPEPEEPAKKPKRRRRPLIEVVEDDDEPDLEDFPEEPAPEPRPRKKGPRSVKRGGRDGGAPQDDDSFDKIFE